MAQANAVQREPSMEEILASIRRIIEDSDQPKPSANDDAPPAELEASEPEVAGADEAAFEAELADLMMGEGEPVDEAPAVAAHEPVGAEPTPKGATFERPAATVSNFPEAVRPEAVAARQEPVQPVAPPFQPSTELRAEPMRSSIISEQAGRQVAAAFGELSEAFAASRRRSFDEMAEEMMRPMLQEWMDNNLPHLVERLVREEIERIARG